MATYDIGERVRLEAHFTDVDGVPADPSTVMWKVRAPSGVWTTLSGVERVTTGHYVVSFTITQAGEWTQRCLGDGALIVTEEKTFFCRRSYV